jgi:DNA-binding CsgD family transcriptional regulator/tetratricopeptide (TPR) repeat protein
MARIDDRRVELLERDGDADALGDAIDASRTAGRVAVVLGEAGIGKTALVTAVCGALDTRRVLWGACDPLITPRPMGPLRDVAREAGRGMLAAMEGSGGREDVLAAALDELADASVLVVEDLHWADDATLDLVALLARRLVRSPGCLILTCRSDALSERGEVQRVLAALPRECTVRIEPEPLSADAVALLARRADREAADLHAVSGGNPFFVTEALAAPAGGGVPASVRDAVALRVGMVDERARDVLELAAVVPGATELWLVSETVGAPAAAVDACIEARLLHMRGEALAFRHDLARRAVEDAISPIRRRELDRLVLRALDAGGADPARLVHHARRAGDAAAIGRFAPVAARAAAAAGGHHQALDHWEAALAASARTRAGGVRDAGAGADGPGANGASGPAEAEALEGVAVEAYLCGHPERALEARRALLALHEAEGDDLRVGDDLRWLSRVLWWLGRGAEAAEAGDRSIAVLEAFPDSRELAMALSGRSQLAMLAEEREDAVALGDRAVGIARRIGDREIVAHALTNVGTTLAGREDGGRGRELLEEAFALAADAGQEDHAARALVNIALTSLVRRRDDPRMDEDLERALRFARERELQGYVQYLLGARAVLRVQRGDWPAAEADARTSLGLGEHRGVSLCPALIALGRMQARRGDGEAGATLDEAWRVAVETREMQRLAPAAAARAEHAWLDGDEAGTVAAARQAWDVVAERGDAWSRGELAYWLWRAGAPVPARPDDPEPYARTIAGDWRGAAAAWSALGFPYEHADALSDADDEAARIEALAAFDRFGAARSAANLRRRLRAAGVRRIPRGPRPASRAGPAGLTPRETQVLIVRGATNAQIAQTLVIAPKTVDHHVSAVLGKLGVASRREAGAAVARLDGSRPES